MPTTSMYRRGCRCARECSEPHAQGRGSVKLVTLFDGCTESATNKVDMATLVFHRAWNRAEVAAESHAEYCYRYKRIL